MRLDYRGSVDPSTGKEHVGFRVLPSTQRGEEIVLKPGCNTVPAARWLLARDFAAVKHLLEAGQIVVLEDDSDGKLSKGKTFDLSRLPPHAAHDLAKRTIEPDTLREWIEQVQTVPNAAAYQHVLTQLEKQLDEVTTDAKGNPATQREIKLAA